MTGFRPISKTRLKGFQPRARIPDAEIDRLKQEVSSQRLVGLRHLRGPGMEFTNLPVEGSAAGLFQESEVQRAVQEMRRPRPIPLMDLWLERSVAATAKQGGWFTPLYSPRKATPAYLLLVDCAGKRDQQTRMADEMVSRLTARRVPVDVF